MKINNFLCMYLKMINLNLFYKNYINMTYIDSDSDCDLGTYFLSYLASFLFELESDICMDQAIGTLKNTICGIPVGSSVRFTMISENELKVDYLLPDCTPNVSEWMKENSDNYWFDQDNHHPQILTKNIKFSLEFKEI
jgi:hypothetical protein